MFVQQYYGVAGMVACSVLYMLLIDQFAPKMQQLYRGYYTVARRYEFCVRVARTISHE